MELHLETFPLVPVIEDGAKHLLPHFWGVAIAGGVLIGRMAQAHNGGHVRIAKPDR